MSLLLWVRVWRPVTFRRIVYSLHTLPSAHNEFHVGESSFRGDDAIDLFYLFVSIGTRWNRDHLYTEAEHTKKLCLAPLANVGWRWMQHSPIAWFNFDIRFDCVDAIAIIHFYSLHSPTVDHIILLFCRYDVLIGVTRAEAYFAFNFEDVQYGIEADRRSKILRTYVRNTYRYHLNEILATIVNEYTDWERPIQHPINIRWVCRRWHDEAS